MNGSVPFSKSLPRRLSIAATLLCLISFSASVLPVSTYAATTTKSTTAKSAVTSAKAPAKKTSTPAKKPSTTSVATSTLEYSGWIPYWAGTKAINDARANLSSLTEINPFGYTVKLDGTLYDPMNVSSTTWQALFKEARAKNVKIIPTVMWSSGATIDAILRDPASRAKHIQSIVDTVAQNKYDGIDIDYEGKLAETKDSYSAFLKELSEALKKNNKNAVLVCTIEARQPLSARYAGTPPPNIEYANDLPKVNTYCDQVHIMTYDQMNADIELNRAHAKELYYPIADPAWVEKVVNYMSADIDKKKISIGVATYGYINQAISDVDGNGFSYTKLEAFNPKYALDLAKQLNITPVRNASGELSFSYVPAETPSSLPSQSILSALAPRGTSSGNLAAAGALAFSKTQLKQAPVQFLTWSDSVAIQQKVTLAKKLGVRGIAIFKIDGGEDPALWSVLK